MEATRTELQPFPRDTDYFTAMGLPRRLNIDEKAMEAAFYDLSRRYHPDRWATAGPKARITSLENTALVNKAYKTLRDPWERARYLVELETGSKAAIGAAPPHALFEEILELQEMLSDLRMAIMEGEPAEDLKEHGIGAARPFREAFAATDARLRDLFDKWDNLPNPKEDAARDAILTLLKELLGERRYLLRANADIDAALEGKPAPREI